MASSSSCPIQVTDDATPLLHTAKTSYIIFWVNVFIKCFTVFLSFFLTVRLNFSNFDGENFLNGLHVSLPFSFRAA